MALYQRLTVALRLNGQELWPDDLDCVELQWLAPMSIHEFNFAQCMLVGLQFVVGLK